MRVPRQTNVERARTGESNFLVESKKVYKIEKKLIVQIQVSYMAREKHAKYGHKEKLKRGVNSSLLMHFKENFTETYGILEKSKKLTKKIFENTDSADDTKLLEESQQKNLENCNINPDLRTVVKTQYVPALATVSKTEVSPVKINETDISGIEYCYNIILKPICAEETLCCSNMLYDDKVFETAKIVAEILLKPITTLEAINKYDLNDSQIIDVISEDEFIADNLSSIEKLSNNSEFYVKSIDSKNSDKSFKKNSSVAKCLVKPVVCIESVKQLDASLELIENYYQEPETISDIEDIDEEKIISDPNNWMYANYKIIY